MKTVILIAITITLSGCAVNLSAKDKTLMEQYPSCTNRENFLRQEQPDNNCIIMVRLKEKREYERHQLNIERDLRLKKEKAEHDKWEAEKRKIDIFEALKITKFNLSPALNYDEFIAKVIDNPDDIGWSSNVKTRYGKNAPFMPVVKQQIGANTYIVQSMHARDNPYKIFHDHKGRLLLVRSHSTLIKDMPIDKPHTLRYEGVTTINTVMGAPKQVIAVTLTKTTK